jgi:hypothetical protein
MAVLASAKAPAVASETQRSTLTGDPVRFNGMQAVRVQNAAQRHNPHAQRGALDEKERHQLRILGLPNRSQHAHRTHERRKISSLDRTEP